MRVPGIGVGQCACNQQLAQSLAARAWSGGMTVFRDVGNYLPLTRRNMPEELNLYIKLNCVTPTDNFCSQAVTRYNTVGLHCYIP